MTMMLGTTELLILSLGAGALGSGPAVQSRRADPLASPTRPLVCRPASPNANRPGLIPVTLLEAAPDSLTEPRVLAAVFDSTGAPRELFLAMHENLGRKRAVFTAITVVFGDSAKGTRATTDFDPTGDPKARGQLPKTTELMTAAEIRRAGQLAVWIWNHRCGKPPAD